MPIIRGRSRRPETVAEWPRTYWKYSGRRTPIGSAAAWKKNPAVSRAV
jgi:hypothetical protein